MTGRCLLGKRTRAGAVFGLAAGLLLTLPRPATGFSILAHQAVVDSAWDDSIAPALRRRFPGADADALQRARAFAYGGSHIADLG